MFWFDPHAAAGRALRVLAPAAFLALAAGQAAGQVLTDLRVVARTLDLAPGGGGGGTAFGAFASPVANDLGQVAFRSLAAGVGGVPPFDGVFLASPDGVLTRVAAVGRTLPGGGTLGDVGGQAFPLRLNDAGQTLFLAGVAGGSTDVLLRADGDGSLTEILRGGAPAPDGNGAIVDLAPAAFSDSGRALVQATISVPGQGLLDTAVYRAGGGVPAALSLVARSGQVGPGGFGPYTDVLDAARNDPGDVVFRATAGGMDGSPGNRDAVVLAPRGDAPRVLLAATNGPVADGGPDATFLRLTRPAVNPDGRVAFAAGVAIDGGSDTAPPRDAPAVDAVFVTDPSGALRQAAAVDRPVAGLAGPLVEVGVPSIDGAGRAVFSGRADAAGDGVGRRGLFAATFSGALPEALVLVGDAGPDGEAFDRVGSFALNSAGQIAFDAGVGGQDGLYFLDPRLGFFEVAAEGATDGPLPAGAAAVESVVFDVLADADPDADGLGDDGRVAFGFALDDGREGIAAWTPPDAASVLPGDATLDGRVNLEDFTILADRFGDVGRGVYFQSGDFNADRQVNLADFTILADHFGDATPADAAVMAAWRATVPEPSAAALILAAVPILLRRRPRLTWDRLPACHGSGG